MSIEAPRRRGSAPTTRRSEYDVSDQIDTTDHTAVNREIRSIFHDLYPAASPDLVSRAVADVATLYRGEWPAYHACDTTYHNLQHVLEVTLAMARLIDGHERSRQRSDAASCSSASMRPGSSYGRSGCGSDRVAAMSM